MTDITGTDAIPAPDGAVSIIDTDYEVGQDNVRTRIGPFGLDIHQPVFPISGLVVISFVAAVLLFHDSVGPVFSGVRVWLTSNFDWFFLLAGNVFVVLALGIAISPLGRIRIGGRKAVPDFGYIGWFSMLFAAGMGIGLIFYGVSEPISHYSSAIDGVVYGEAGRTDWAPLGGAAGNVAEATRLSMAATIFHWALHPWGVYAIVGLSLALFAYNKGLPLTFRSIFYPIFREKIWGWPGHIIDILAVFATLSGLATSLGLGAEQATAGLQYLFGIEPTSLVKIMLVIGISAIAMASVVAGLDAGVKRLSEINMLLAAMLALFMILVGPTWHLITSFFDNMTAYLEHLPALAAPFGREDDQFRQGWTSFYWAWWISWSPFVGMFIARVSRGRTVREFIVSVLLVPSVVSILWMTIFGNSAIDLAVLGGEQAIFDASVELRLFEMLNILPWAQLTSLIGITLVIVFFVTSSDSGSLVIDTITAGGKVNAPLTQRVFWVIFVGLVAIALLVGGGLTALQAMSVSTGFPFAIVLLLACFSLISGLSSEPRLPAKKS
ncbi:BCCT family transporter [Pseudovibrio exalbescens]|uniref:BCCT transporter n=1 Tax=Pseudovibrio exalbescens TaxID=197461 RepID=A0A1U7JLG8_9HYPH|nr:BCCT family transporter [Pseudovibrio exalbescens]OKL45569.1 BCCT transporter [Pseudovibrio exalbescens]